MYRADGRRCNQARTMNVVKKEGVELEHGCSRVVSTLEYSRNSAKGFEVKVVLTDGAVQKEISEKTVEQKQEEIEKIVSQVFKDVYLEKDSRYVVHHRVKYVDGSLVALLVNSTSLVLLLYSVPVKHMVFGVSCGVSQRKRDEYLVDLTEEEEKERVPMGTVAVPYIKHKKMVSLVMFENCVPEDECEALIGTATKHLDSIAKDLVEKASKAFQLQR